MTQINRRTALSQFIAFAAAASTQAHAQTAANGPAQPPHLSYSDITRRARDLAAAPFAAGPFAPEPLAKLDYDTWRDIHFRSDKAFLAGSNFHLHPFHLGASYRQPLTINLVRDGIATPIPYANHLFDYGRAKFDRNLPVNLGFAGLQLMALLNDPRVFDPCLEILGLTNFRLAGRDQSLGLSARAVTINAGLAEEEYPFFRELWIETPEANADTLTLYAVLDSPSVTGALKFDISAGALTYADITTTLYPRKPNIKIGCAPLACLFFAGENNHKLSKDYHPELHDADGLLMNTGAGEWIWRPLRNPDKLSTTAFLDTRLRGFGLMQRDRLFDHYQDLTQYYETRSSYWVEPKDAWGNGRIELVEAPTTQMNSPNVTASWVFSTPAQVAQAMTFAYRISAFLDQPHLSPNARVINMFQENIHALGSNDPITPTKRRFILDFAGGDLSYYQDNPQSVEFVPSTTFGRIIKKEIVYHPLIGGFRAICEVDLGRESATDMRAFLRAGNRTLSETWTFPWSADEII